MNNYSEELKLIFKEAENIVLKTNALFLKSHHIILSLLSIDNIYKDILEKYINYNEFDNKINKNTNTEWPIILYSPEIKKIISAALIESREKKQDTLDIQSLLLELLSTDNSATRILRIISCDIEKLISDILTKITFKSHELINSIGTNLNDKVNESNIIYGRNNEIQQIIETLARKNKCNPLLIGNPGTGKTATVEYLAYLIKNKQVPAFLKNKKILSISMGELVAGTKYRGEFEEKLINLIKELEQSKDTILFIDEFHTIINAGGAEGAIDAANIMKPALARGTIQCIGATTIEEYHNFIECDKALERRFQKIIINEPTKKETLKLLLKIKPSYENYHNVCIDDSLLNTIVEMSEKYIPNKHQPDKSIDLLDQICAKNSTHNNNKINIQIAKYNEIKNMALKCHNYTEAIKIDKKINKCLENNKKVKISQKSIKEIIEKIANTKIVELENTEKYKVNLITSLNKKFPNDKDKIIETLTYLTNLNNNSLTINDTDTIKIIKEYCNRTDTNIITISDSEFYTEQSILKITGAYYDNYFSIFDEVRDHPKSLILVENIKYINTAVINLLKKIASKKVVIKNNNEKIYLHSCFFVFVNKSISKSIGFVTNF